MAATLVNVVFSLVGAKSAHGDIEVYQGVPLAAENIATPVASTQSAEAPRACIARITPVGGAIYAKVGVNPTAAAGDDWYIADGESMDLAIPAGHKVAVIDA